MSSAIRTRLSALPANTDLMAEFPRWIMQECDPASVVLEIGAGEGKYGYPAAIRSQVARLVGIDPDSALARNPYLDDRYPGTVEEFAREHDARFDCLYSMFVLEHVSDPAGFLTACRSLLRPRGKLFAATPNLWHYFGATAKATAALGVEDWLLERLRGREMKESYHFPTAYRMNSVRALTRALAQAGFRQVDFRCFDEPSRFQVYLPPPARWFPSFYSRLVYTLGLPQAMGILMFKATL
ncbi:MAG: methyltransferase domain-containing protein [Gemmatimonadetes bacterium]|nr:methyltransferase domain-containing protein [Gemmatimonadota bacterium]